MNNKIEEISDSQREKTIQDLDDSKDRNKFDYETLVKSVNDLKTKVLSHSKKQNSKIQFLFGTMCAGLGYAVAVGNVEVSILFGVISAVSYSLQGANLEGNKEIVTVFTKVVDQNWNTLIGATKEKK